MADGYNERQLRAHILPMSDASIWEVAKKEWSLIGIDFSDEPQQCLCGHFPIIEICQIKNNITKNITEVGNVCVKRFLGLNSHKIFDCIKRLKKDISKSLNEDSIVFFRERGLLSDFEFEFCQSTMNKRNLSEKQIQIRKEINEKILAAIGKRGFVGPS